VAVLSSIAADCRGLALLACLVTQPASAGECGAPATRIHQIQGSGFSSPHAGRVHEIEGVVVGNFQPGLRGFFVQEEDGDADADPRTSEGIFVYRAPGIEPVTGDTVRIRGRVAEYRGLTELKDVDSAVICARGTPVTPARVTLPVDSAAAFEAVEGMAVVLPQTLFISDHADFDRYNEIGLSSARRYQPTQLLRPGTATGEGLALANSLDRITLDDGRRQNNMRRHPGGGRLDLERRFRGGDTLARLTGVMDFAFGRYRIQPTGAALYEARNPRTPRSDDVGGSLRVASFNLQNFFTSFAGRGKICGPARNLSCRGANDAAEFARQHDKLITAILALDADVLGLQEIENHPADAALRRLVEGLNAVAGDGSYAAIDTGPLGDDAIKVAIVYRPAAVSPIGPFAVLDDRVDPGYRSRWNRPALAQTFAQPGGGRFTLAVNHLKSRRGGCDAPGDRDAGDGQGQCNRTRSAAMLAEAAWLASDPTGSGDADFLIVGDLNAYAREDPLTLLHAHGYTDLVGRFLGRHAYTYLHAGQLGYLDHALANHALLEQVSGATIWHINADEPDIFAYRGRGAQPHLHAPGPYRSADHDPLVIGLE
jgi:predicted extracellular nuclease